MQFSAELWIRDYVGAAKELFGERIWFIGLQGSYGRGEAAPESDIDVVLILDRLSEKDILAYSAMLDTLSHRDKACGFISGKEELICWEPSDLFQFYYDTAPIMGSLDELAEKIRKEDVARAVRIGACNTYHICVHNLVHEKSLEILKGAYKSAVFMLQAIAFLETGKYVKNKSELRLLLSREEQTVLKAGLAIKSKAALAPEEFIELSSLLIDWSSQWLVECGNGKWEGLYE